MVLFDLKKSKDKNLMKNKIKFIFRILLPVFILYAFLPSCREKEEYPDEPLIEFVSFTNLRNYNDIDTLGLLLISYTDGDGDLGLYSGDTSKNIFVSYYKMEDGVLKIGTRYNYVTGKIDTINFNGGFPVLAPQDYSGWLKGEIEDTITPLYDPTSNKTYDTVMFKTYIIDRAGNKSNVVQTPLIIVKNR